MFKRSFFFLLFFISLRMLCSAQSNGSNDLFYKNASEEISSESYYLSIPVNLVPEHKIKQMVIMNISLYENAYRDMSTGEYAQFIFNKLKNHDTLQIEGKAYEAFTKLNWSPFIELGACPDISDRSLKEILKDRFDKHEGKGYGFDSSDEQDKCFFKQLFDKGILIHQESYSAIWYYKRVKKNVVHKSKRK